MTLKRTVKIFKHVMRSNEQLVHICLVHVVELEDPLVIAVNLVQVSPKRTAACRVLQEEASSVESSTHRTVMPGASQHLIQMSMSAQIIAPVV